MSEKRGYTAISKVKTEVLELLAQGKTHREVAEHFGFRDKYVVTQFVKRHNKRQQKIAAGIMPRKQGRHRKDEVQLDAELEKDYEIKRLKMENELLRDFLRATGRKWNQVLNMKSFIADGRNIRPSSCVDFLAYHAAVITIILNIGNSHAAMWNWLIWLSNVNAPATEPMATAASKSGLCEKIIAL